MKTNIFPNSWTWALLFIATVQSIDKLTSGTATTVDYFLTFVVALYWIIMLMRRNQAKHQDGFALKENR